MTIAIPIQPDVRPSYGRNPAYTPIIGMTELAFENTAKWLDGNKTARMLYPSSSYYNDQLGYSGDTQTIQGNLTGMAGAMSGWGYTAKSDLIAASGTRKYVIPPFCRSTSLAKIRVSQGVATGTGVAENGTIDVTSAKIDDDTVISLYKSASTARIGFFNRTGANWALDTSTQIVGSGVSSVTQLIPMSSTKFAAIYYDGSISQIIIFTISGTTVTAGSAASIASSSSDTSACLATTDVLVTLQRNTASGNAASVRVVTVSGTTPTVNAMVVCPGASPVIANQQMLAQIDTNLVAVGYLNSGSNKGAVAGFTVSGSTGSFGTAGSIGNTSGDLPQKIIKYTTSSGWLVYDGGGGSSKRMYGFTISPNVSFAGDITIEAAGSWNAAYYDSATNKVYAGCNSKTKRYTVNSVTSFTLDFSLSEAFSTSTNPPSGVAITSTGTVFNLVGTSAYYLVAANISVQIKANAGDGGDETAITLSGAFLYQYVVDVNSDFYRKVYLLITNNDASFASTITVDNIICETI